MARIGSEPEFRQKRLIDAGLEPVFDTPDEFAAFLKENRAAAGRIVKEAGLQPQQRTSSTVGAVPAGQLLGR